MKKKLLKLLLSTVLLSGCSVQIIINGDTPSLPTISMGNSSVTTESSSDDLNISNSLNKDFSSSSSLQNSSTNSSLDKEEYNGKTYSNPVYVKKQDEDAYYENEVADPTVVKGDDGYFYCVATNRIMLRSSDACNWEVVTRNIIDHPSWGASYSSSSYGLWAPDLVKVQDKWIYYYSLSGWGSPIGIGYAVADDIAGPYVDKGKLFTGNEIGIQNCIDPQVFVDDDNRVYMTVGSFQGLYVLELTSDGTACLNGIEYQRGAKTLIGGRESGWDGSQYEGGYIIKKGEWYYYFGSVGTCCEGQNSTYRVVAGRSKNPTGPYVDKNGNAFTKSYNGTNYGELVIEAGSNKRNVVGPGHNSIFVDDAGEYWMYYHAFSSQDDFYTRHLFMDKILWDKDGYPYVENRMPSFLEAKNGPRFLDESNESEDNTNVIKSLTAKNEMSYMKLGQEDLVSNYYKLEGYKALSSKQKGVTVTSSNSDIIEIDSSNKILKAKGIGTAVITVTSTIDSSKSCSFSITVEQEFFDKNYAPFNSSWDSANENNKTNPYVRVNTNNADGIYAKGSEGIKWYIETEITIHQVYGNENWPKFGILANSFSNTSNGKNNKVYFFFDAPMNNQSEWKNFGICEVYNGNDWAWNGGVGNDRARHNDAVASINTPITFNETFKMGMLRDGFNFHLFVNDNYLISVASLHHLMGNIDNSKNDGSYKPTDAMAGFFSFNSDVTFSNYRLVTNDELVNAYMPSTPVYNNNWAAD